jgi:hypothetical protein
VALGCIKLSLWWREAELWNKIVRTAESSSVLKGSCRLLKKIQMCGAQKYKDESGNLKAEFIFQFS